MFLNGNSNNPLDYCQLNSYTGTSALELKAGANVIDFGYNNDYSIRLRQDLSTPNLLRLQGGMLGIEGSKNENFGQYAYYAKGPNGAVNTGPGANGSNGNISLKTSGRILAEEFDAVSDKRIKNIQYISNNKEDYATIQKLQVTDYKHIDVATKGADTKKGFIAQQVKEIFPEAVSFSKDFIPNIYAIATKVEDNEAAKTLTIYTDKNNDCKKGDKIRLIADTKHEVEIIAATEKSITVTKWDEKPVKEIFVYGKEVSDFHSVDYDRIFTLNVSATQQLIKEMQALKAENAALKTDLQGMKTNFDTLEAKVERLLKSEGDATPSGLVKNK